MKIFNLRISRATINLIIFQILMCFVLASIPFLKGLEIDYKEINRLFFISLILFIVSSIIFTIMAIKFLIITKKNRIESIKEIREIKKNTIGMYI